MNEKNDIHKHTTHDLNFELEKSVKVLNIKNLCLTTKITIEISVAKV